MYPDTVNKKFYLKHNLLFLAEHMLGYKRLLKFFPKSIHQLEDEILSKPQIKNRNTKLDVKTASADSVDLKNKEFKKLLTKPLLFKGAAKNWDATQKWNLDFFENEFGEADIFVLDTVGAIDKNNPQKFEKLPLKSYISQLKLGSLKYLKFSNLVQKQLKLQDDLDKNWLSKFNTGTSLGERFYMFIGGKGTITPLHNELPAVVYIQVHGTKKWVLYPPEERLFLNPRTERRLYFYSEANPYKYDSTHQLEPYAQRYEITMDAGDVLWFPPFYWHYVENLSDSIGVAYKVNDLFGAFKSSKMLTSLYLMATKPFLIYNFITLRFGNKNVDTKSAHS